MSGMRNFDDSTVSVTSASLDFARPGRTRVIPYCHTSLTGILSIACAGSAPAIARMTTTSTMARKSCCHFSPARMTGSLSDRALPTTSFSNSVRASNWSSAMRRTQSCL